MKKKASVCIAKGDGIGPEIMTATLRILEAGGAALEIHEVEVGEQVYLRGEPTGIARESWEIIRNCQAFLKAPITTPQGGGYKSLNVTIRTTFGLFANIRPCASYAPFIPTKHPEMDLVVVRENEEDLYTGIEYRQSQQTYHALKIITRPGCEKIIRYAFEYARAHGRKKVTCFTKDNILKLSDGLFHKIFEEIAPCYPDIEHEHWIVDIGAAKLADKPELFDVLVLPNLYGDILSDVTAQISGSVGLAGSANIGDQGAMFEAIHGSAPRHAGQDRANPSGLLLAGVQMLVYLGQPEEASRIHNGWLKTIEDGVHTYDIYHEGVSKQLVGTRQFAEAIVARLGQIPNTLKPVSYEQHKKISTPLSPIPLQAKVLIGVDIFIEFQGTVENLQKKLKGVGDPSTIELQMIANRGAIVWPEKAPEIFCVDTWRCRYLSAKKGQPVPQKQILSLLQKMADSGLSLLKTEQLFTFDGKPGFSSSGN